MWCGCSIFIRRRQDLTYLPETKTILIPMMLDNALVAYKLE